MKHASEMTDVLEALSMDLQHLSDRVYLMLARDCQPFAVADLLRSQIILSLEDVLARAKNLEDKILAPVRP